MKKLIATVVATAMCLGFSMPLAAGTINQDSADTLGTDFTCTVENNPTYTVTIPSAVTISQNGTVVDITAENVANLGDQEISVTIGGTDYFRNQLVLEGEASNGQKKVLRYQIIKSDGTTIETTGTDTATGTELAAFTEDGTVNYTVKPVIAASTSKGVTYTGSMTYGISLVDAQ